MVIIVFQSGADWFKAFRQLAADVAKRNPDDDIRASLEEAEALGMLDFTNMDHRLSDKLTAAIKDIAQQTVNGAITGWRTEDHAGNQMYREAMIELLAVIHDN